VTSLLTTNGAFEINVDQGGDISGETIAFKMSGSEKMRIDSSGKVGIGTTSPNRVFEINNSQPCIRLTNGTNGFDIGTGGFVDGSNSLIFFDEGVGERMRIDSSGNVGINATSLSDKFTIGDGDLKFFNSDEANNHRTTFIEFQNSSNRITSESNFGSGSSSAYAAGYKFTTKNFNGSAFETLTPFVIQANGNVGIGTTSPDALLHLESNGVSVIRLTDNDTTAEDNQIIGKIEFETRDSNASGVATEIASVMTDTTAGATALTFKSGTPSTISERMRIDPIGRLLHGCTSATGGTSEGNITVEFPGNSRNGIKLRDTNNTGTVNHVVLVSGSTDIGQIIGTTSSVSYSSASDYRLKENVVAISDGISRLKLLKPSKFNFKVTPDETVDGFLAHEVMSVVPQAVSGTKDAVDSDGKPIHQSMDSAKLVPLLTAALQEEISKRETLETRVAALEAA